MTQHYYAAREIASRVDDHFTRLHAEAVQHGTEQVAPAPDRATVEALVDAAFWASLRREEGYSPTISLAFLPPNGSTQPLIFERRFPLEPAMLAKVAPAVAPRGIHLGVWRDRDGLAVWGTTRILPRFCFVVEVEGPGLLVIKHRRHGEGDKFANIAVLEGDQIKIVDERASSLPECPPLLTSLLGFTTPSSWASSVNVLVRLAVAMRAHRHGGSLLVVPPGSKAWRESILHPIPYAVSPPYSELAHLIRDTGDAQRDGRWRDLVDRAVETIASLTAVDGATIITDQFELLAFGAKIARRDGSPPVEQLVVTEPIEGGLARRMEPSQIGGTRHLSAAQFVQDQHDAAALVASQDGRFTVFAWTMCDSIVRAHRVETLLL